MIQGDSNDYHVIYNAVNAIPAALRGLSCEVGLRMGEGTKWAVDALQHRKGHKVHVGVDPYGNLPYEWMEHRIVTLDYYNTMRDNIIGEIYQYCGQRGVNFIFLNMTDEQFFDRFRDGIPFYDGGEELFYQKYIFVHFDGPHQFVSLKKEFAWFNDRMEPGATCVFDDITFYDFEKMHPLVKASGWATIELTSKKIAYQKIK